MANNGKSKKIILMLGDIILLYFGLFITLTIRYGSFPSQTLWEMHNFIFLFVYIIWIIIFYIAGLYDIEKFISATTLRNRIIKTITAGGIIAVLIFYLVPFFQITPKTNLFINVIISFLLIWGWRKLLLSFSIKSSKIKVYFLSEEKEIKDFSKYINDYPQIGYKTTDNKSDAHIIVISEKEKRKEESLHSLYEMIKSGKTIINFDKFYEAITGKIPVSLIGETWFLENLMELKKQDFEKFKRVNDVILSMILFIPFLITLPFIATAIKLNGKGPVFYKQKRVGKNGKVFDIIKYRSMIMDAEKNGAQWAAKKDERVTFIGNVLRKTRVDELPQIWNVLAGDLSFAGPRPERPEFVKELAEKIPHYSMRHLVKPGLSGWAQINFPYGASIEDAMEKTQYDLFYIKNRSISLEFSILLKTLMIIVSREGR